MNAVLLPRGSDGNTLLEKYWRFCELRSTTRSRAGEVSPRERSVDASEVHDSHHRLRFVTFTYNASYDPLAGAPSMLAFFLDSCLERINSATPGFIFLELLSAFA